MLIRLFVFMNLRTPRSTLFSYTTLFRSDDDSEVVRYLTGGVLVRVNRISQKPQSELATEWKVLDRSEEHTSELQSRFEFVCRLLHEKKKKEEDFSTLKMDKKSTQGEKVA